MLHDLILAVRSLGRRPGFVLLVALTLGIGIGANVGIFSYLSYYVLPDHRGACTASACIESGTARPPMPTGGLRFLTPRFTNKS